MFEAVVDGVTVHIVDQISFTVRLQFGELTCGIIWRVSESYVMVQYNSPHTLYGDTPNMCDYFR